MTRHAAVLGVRMKRYSMKQMHDSGTVDGATKKLFVDGDEVALVYFRAGYTPTDYPSDDEWSARVKIEVRARSRGDCLTCFRRVMPSNVRLWHCSWQD
jgi:hypothetical protein